MIDMGDKVKTLGCSTTTSLHAQMRLQYSVSTPSALLGEDRNSALDLLQLCKTGENEG